jgi:uridylate kinase
MEEKRFKRIMLKIGGESLLGDREFGIDPKAVLVMAQKIKTVVEQKVETAIVIGGGNIFRGLAASKNGIDRAIADYMGMLATVMNGLALQDALRKVGVAVRTQSALTMPAVSESFIRNKAIRHLEKGRVLILVAGTGMPYVTTDSGAALHALELHCDVLMKATKVDGIYEQDPLKFPDAKRFKTMTFKDAIEKEEVQIMDTGALAMCKENNMPIMVFNLFKEHDLKKAVTGEDVGTYLANDVETRLV